MSPRGKEVVTHIPINITIDTADGSLAGIASEVANEAWDISAGESSYVRK
jgi:hypothetical protein